MKLLTLLLAGCCVPMTAPTEPEVPTTAPTPSPMAAKVGTCCAKTDGAGAGFPALPGSEASCQAGPSAEGPVPDGLCAEGPYAAGTVDVLGGDVGGTRTVTLWGQKGTQVQLTIPAGAAVTHPDSLQIVWPNGDRAKLEQAFEEAFRAAGFTREGTMSAADAPTEVYGDSIDYDGASVSVRSDCGGRKGVVCALPGLVAPPPDELVEVQKHTDGAWAVIEPCPPDEKRTVKVAAGKNELFLGLAPAEFEWAKVRPVPQGWSFESEGGDEMTLTWVDRASGLVRVQSDELNGTFVTREARGRIPVYPAEGCTPME